MNIPATSTFELKRFYQISAISMTVVVLLTLTDLVFGNLTGGFSSIPETTIGRFEEFEQSIIMGLYHLDLLNIFINTLSAIGFVGLFLAHSKERPVLTGFAALLFIVGLIMFLSINTALPMMSIAERFNESTDTAYKAALISAGEIMIARGEHGSLSMFMSMFFMVTAGIAMSWQMLKCSVFKPSVAIIGLISYISLLVYIILLSFFPSTKNIAMIIVAPGGILGIIWQILVARKFLALGSIQ